MIKIKHLSNIIFLILVPYLMQAQTFNVGVLGGLTFSQVNGDALAGYDKLGAEIGVKTNVYFNSRWDASLELHYSQRGSASEITFGGDNAFYVLKMDYVSIPLLVEFKDWIVKDEDKQEFAKIRFSGGLAFGRLIKNEDSDGFSKDFKTNDLSFLLGMTFSPNRHLGFILRYTRSIIPLDTVISGVTVQEELRVIPHHVTIGAQYMFL
jgi:hypothetical protein